MQSPFFIPGLFQPWELKFIYINEWLWRIIDWGAIPASKSNRANKNTLVRRRALLIVSSTSGRASLFGGRTGRLASCPWDRDRIFSKLARHATRLHMMLSVRKILQGFWIHLTPGRNVRDHNGNLSAGDKVRANALLFA